MALFLPAWPGTRGQAWGRSRVGAVPRILRAGGERALGRSRVGDSRPWGRTGGGREFGMGEAGDEVGGPRAVHRRRRPEARASGDLFLPPSSNRRCRGGHSQAKGGSSSSALQHREMGRWAERATKPHDISGFLLVRCRQSTTKLVIARITYIPLLHGSWITSLHRTGAQYISMEASYRNNIAQYRFQIF